MGLQLMEPVLADVTWLGTLGFIWNVTLVLLGLNFVIFVHELGHFLVAKLCGVKCEKFYIWFDVAGWRIWRYKWGETEYGIGWLPLGGYVKMLGQEDNPARLREEIARAKAQQSAQAGGTAAVDSAAPPAATASDATAPTGDSGQPIDVDAAEQALFNPRSYLAKSVPKRMAIISAGVIMNVIFALLMAAAAYGLGVYQLAGGVGSVAPGEAAWQAGIRPGDDVLEIGGKPIHRFNDLRSAVSLGDLDGGLPILVHRPGVEEPFTVRVEPDRLWIAPTIGVTSPLIPTLMDALPAYPGSAAAKAQPPFHGGDKIVEINGQKATEYAHIHRQLARNPDKTLRVVVERKAKPDKGEKPSDEAPITRVAIDLPPEPVQRLGLVMQMGPISAVQSGSPAAECGLEHGDVIVRIDGNAVGDPMTLADRLRLRAGKAERIRLTVVRDGQERTFDNIPLRDADWYETPVLPRNPWSAPALGIAYEVLPVVEAVLEGSPAATAGIHPGDEVVGGKLVPPEPEELKKLNVPETTKSLNVQAVRFVFRDDTSEKSWWQRRFRKEQPKATWPYFFRAIQEMLPGGSVELTLADGRVIPLQPQAATGWHNADRGLVLQAEGSVVKGETLGEAFRLGWIDTLDALTMVFRFLQKIGSQVSWRGMAGPVSIVQLAYHSASEGLPSLLMLLTMISANLAVINFLPIPVLDGGHMVFLVYEGVTRRPASERVQGMLTWLGFLFIVGLMLMVLGLDIGLISRN